MLQVQFYCHFNATSLEVTAITPRAEPAHGEQALQLPLDLAISFLNGDENLANWVIGQVEGEFCLRKLSDVSSVNFIDRLQVSGLDALKPADWRATWDWSGPLPDVVVVINVADSTVDVHYNGEALKFAVNPLRFYITKLDDPTYLLGAYTLTPAVLDKVLADNGLEEWPNPLRVAVPDPTDISIFIIKTPLKVVCETKEAE
jgi:hypothetical protein